jgi:hypothetical protein
MATFDEFGYKDIYNSKIPITLIKNFIENKYKYNGASISHGEYQATLNFSFIKKYKKLINPNFSISSLLSKDKTPLFIEYDSKIIIEIEKYLIKNEYTNITCSLRNGFQFKILSDKEKEVEVIKEKIQHF